MILEVHIEWPGGSRTEEVEVDDDLTEQQQDEVASETFFNFCNYGAAVKEQP